MPPSAFSHCFFTKCMSFWNSAMASAISALPPAAEYQSHGHSRTSRHSFQLCKKRVRNLCEGMLSLKEHAPFLAVCFHDNRSSSQPESSQSSRKFPGLCNENIVFLPWYHRRVQETSRTCSSISAWLQLGSLSAVRCCCTMGLATLTSSALVRMQQHCSTEEEGIAACSPMQAFFGY